MRKKEEKPERERQRENELSILMREMRESVIKKKNLALSYSAHLKIDVHCS